MLSLLWLGLLLGARFDPWPRELLMLWMLPKKRSISQLFYSVLQFSFVWCLLMIRMDYTFQIINILKHLSNDAPLLVTESSVAPSIYWNKSPFLTSSFRPY